MEINIAAFSDTHGFHDIVELPTCDIVIFSGDYSGRGSYHDTKNFLEWYSKQYHCVAKVLVAGNHDLAHDPKYSKETNANDWLEELLSQYPDIHYLENSHINLMGLKIWGSPITPDFFPEHWAFNKPRGEEIKKIWDNIPFDSDIVITHGPCEFIGDYISYQNKFVGCKDLAYRMEEIKPQLHICGHIHDGYGITDKDGVIYANAAICDEKYRPVNKPHLITLSI